MGNHGLQVGNYMINEGTNKLHYWISQYAGHHEIIEAKDFRGINTMVYKFNGSEFELEVETGSIK